MRRHFCKSGCSSLQESRRYCVRQHELQQPQIRSGGDLVWRKMIFPFQLKSENEKLGRVLSRSADTFHIYSESFFLTDVWEHSTDRTEPAIDCTTFLWLVRSLDTCWIDYYFISIIFCCIYLSYPTEQKHIHKKHIHKTSILKRPCQKPGSAGSLSVYKRWKPHLLWLLCWLGASLHVEGIFYKRKVKRQSLFIHCMASNISEHQVE